MSLLLLLFLLVLFFSLGAVVGWTARETICEKQHEDVS